MKKLAMLCLALVMGAGMTMAAKPAAEKKTVTTVFVTDIDCDNCAQKIMNNIPSLGKGIKDVQVDVAAKEVSVTYDAAKNSDQNIVKGLASLKVKAQPKTVVRQIVRSAVYEKSGALSGFRAFFALCGPSAFPSFVPAFFYQLLCHSVAFPLSF